MPCPACGTHLNRRLDVKFAAVIFVALFCVNLLFRSDMVSSLDVIPQGFIFIAALVIIWIADMITFRSVISKKE
jgi:hypothetical protein